LWAESSPLRAEAAILAATATPAAHTSAATPAAAHLMVTPVVAVASRAAAADLMAALRVAEADTAVAVAIVKQPATGATPGDSSQPLRTPRTQRDLARGFVAWTAQLH